MYSMPCIRARPLSIALLLAWQRLDGIPADSCLMYALSVLSSLHSTWRFLDVKGSERALHAWTSLFHKTYPS